jgi:type II secretory pathway component PulC
MVNGLAEKPVFSRLQRVVTSRAALRALCVVLALICVVAGVRVVLILVSEPDMPRVVFPAARQGAGQQQIVLFAQPGKSEPAQDLSEASINAELLGVISSGDRALANLRVNNGKETVYKVDDEIANGVTITAIEATRVVVRERGQLRSITLKSLLDNRSGGSVEIEAARVGSTTTNALPVTMTPVITQSGDSAMRIDSLGESVAELGVLQEGDIVTAISGQSLSALFTDPEVQASLLKAQTLTVTVDRDGQELNIDVDRETVNALMAR